MKRVVEPPPGHGGRPTQDMIFQERSLTFREFVMGETVPLAAIQEAVLGFLCDREDAAVFGAQAVNAYVDEPRMSQDVEILSLDGESLAEQIRLHLNEKFNIAVRIRSVADGMGFRIYQVRKPKSRHLVEIRSVEQLPSCNRMERILIPQPAELISQKTLSFSNRSQTAKGMTDLADLRRLLLAFPELKAEQGPVWEALQSAGASDTALSAWYDIVAEEIEPDHDDY